MNVLYEFSVPVTARRAGKELDRQLMAAYSGILDADSESVLTAAATSGDWQLAYETLLDEFKASLGRVPFPPGKWHESHLDPEPHLMHFLAAQAAAAPFPLAAAAACLLAHALLTGGRGGTPGPFPSECITAAAARPGMAAAMAACADSQHMIGVLAVAPLTWPVMWSLAELHARLPRKLTAPLIHLAVAALEAPCNNGGIVDVAVYASGPLFRRITAAKLLEATARQRKQEAAQQDPAQPAGDQQDAAQGGLPTLLAAAAAFLSLLNRDWSRVMATEFGMCREDGLSSGGGGGGTGSSDVAGKAGGNASSSSVDTGACSQNARLASLQLSHACRAAIAGTLLLLELFDGGAAAAAGRIPAGAAAGSSKAAGTTTPARDAGCSKAGKLVETPVLGGTAGTGQVCSAAGGAADTSSTADGSAAGNDAAVAAADAGSAAHSSAACSQADGSIDADAANSSSVRLIPEEAAAQAAVALLHSCLWWVAAMPSETADWMLPALLAPLPAEQLLQGAGSLSWDAAIRFAGLDLLGEMPVAALAAMRNLLRHGLDALGTLWPLVETHTSCGTGAMSRGRMPCPPSAADVATVSAVVRLARRRLAAGTTLDHGVRSAAAARRARLDAVMASQAANSLPMALLAVLHVAAARSALTQDAAAAALTALSEIVR